MAVISINGLSKTYGEPGSESAVTAVNDLTLDVPEGRIFGFLGPNGAGKTTTIKLLLGLISADEGDATILDEPMGSIKAKQRLGFLSESPYFYNYLTAAEFLEFYAKLFEMRKFRIESKIEELMELVGLTGRENVKLSKFSRGMLQRIGIAQALLNNPDLVILDEPITGLDPAGRKEVREIILNLRKQGKSVFFSSHVLHDVQEMCDDIGIINKGKLVCKGSLNDLLSVKEFSISAEDIPSDIADKIETAASSVSKKDNKLTAATEDEDTFNKLKELFSKNGKNVSESHTRASLEDFFLEQVESSGKGEE